MLKCDIADLTIKDDDMTTSLIRPGEFSHLPYEVCSRIVDIIHYHEANREHGIGTSTSHTMTKSELLLLLPHLITRYPIMTFEVREDKRFPVQLHIFY